MAWLPGAVRRRCAAATAPALIAPAVAALTAAGLLAALLQAAPAKAVGPVDLERTGQVTDRVGALDGRDAEVERALLRLEQEQGLRLFTVYVRDFSGQSAQTWADATAERGGLGQYDVLLAVATHDREHAVSADVGSGLTQRQIGEVGAGAVEPALRHHDWAGAAVGAAEGYSAVLNGMPVLAPEATPGPEDPGAPAGGLGALPLIALLLAGVVVALLLWLLSRRRRAAARGGRRRRTPRPPSPPADRR